VEGCGRALVGKRDGDKNLGSAKMPKMRCSAETLSVFAFGFAFNVIGRQVRGRRRTRPARDAILILSA
jgi:hypothetical protein